MSATTIKLQIGKYKITYTPLLEMAVVTEQGLLVPVVKFSADDPGALEACQQWAKENQ